MKIELDDRSKIVGTFLVRERGVVSGLSEFVGKEILIILLPERVASSAAVAAPTGG